jgi:integration host factor subunit beta
MTKAQLIERLAERCGCSISQAEDVLNSVLGSIQRALEQQNRVEVRGFGTFEVRGYGSYTGRNPKTGESVSVASKLSPFFKLGKELRLSLNGEHERAPSAEDTSVQLVRRPRRLRAKGQ